MPDTSDPVASELATGWAGCFDVVQWELKSELKVGDIDISVGCQRV